MTETNTLVDPAPVESKIIESTQKSLSFFGRGLTACGTVLRSGCRINADPLFRFSYALELHEAIGESKESIVAADTDILARVHPGSSLANKDAPCVYLLASETLHAQSLGIAVPAVTRASTTFFMSHCLISDQISRHC